MSIGRTAKARKCRDRWRRCCWRWRAARKPSAICPATEWKLSRPVHSRQYDHDPVPARIAVIGDRTVGFEPQDAIESAIQHAANALEVAVPDVEWLATDELAGRSEALLQDAAAVWCAPGGPFRSLDGAIE